MTEDRPIALVTGGASRVGRALCLTLARDGFDIIITYRRSREESHTLQKELKALGASAETHQLDQQDLGSVRTFGQRLAGHLPHLDALIHNASAYEPTPIESLSEAQAIEHMHVNALAPLLLTQALAQSLRQSKLPGGGCIVAMCDIHAMGRPRRQHSAYTMSKAALHEMVYCLARELAPRVRVCGVAPGVVAFPETGHESDPVARQRYLDRVPLGRTGTPEEAAEVVRWLIRVARYITGEIIRLDGGRWLT